jgi:hypothetical protein
VDRAAGQPADERVRLADRRRERRERQHALRGSGEPNGSATPRPASASSRSTDGGQSWSLVAGSQAVALNRSIGAITVKPGSPGTIYIGTDVARHGSSAANGGRRTPPNAPALGVYKSTNGGASWTLAADLASKTPPNPAPPASGVDWFQGGITKLELDPNNTDAVYAAVVGYGLWRSNDAGTTWRQVFQTMNPADTFGDRVEFSAVDLGTTTRIYLGDSSDDLLVARVWRTDDAASIAGSPTVGYSNAGWTELSSSTNGTNGFLAYGYCQNGQCGYDDFVVSPAGQPGVGAGHANELWLGGSMNYDELVAYNGLPPRSNGRAVIRTTNGGALAPDVSWQDMTGTIGSAPRFPITGGIHPDEHAVVFNPTDTGIAFVGSDGGVVRVDVRNPRNASAACSTRRFVYNNGHGAEPLAPADLLDCQRLLSGIPTAITPLNDGLNTIQFQSLSFNPANPTGELLGGTQDNGTFSYTGTTTWFESVGGDGGQSGFDAGNGTIRYHNYFDATPEVNFHGNDPQEWLATWDTLQTTGELRSFYVPFIADPARPGGRTSGSSTSGAPTTTAATGRTSRRTATPCTSTRPGTGRAATGSQLGPNLTGSNFGQTRLGDYVVATERGARRRAHALGGDAHRTRVRQQERRRLAATQRPLLADRHPEHAGPVRVRDRGRSRRPEPRLDLVLRLRGVHAGRARARVRGAVQPGDRDGELH